MITTTCKEQLLCLKQQNNTNLTRKLVPADSDVVQQILLEALGFIFAQLFQDTVCSPPAYFNETAAKFLTSFILCWDLNRSVEIALASETRLHHNRVSFTG